MAAYAFEQLSPEQKQQVMNKVEEIESSILGRPIEFDEVVKNRNKAQLNQLFSLAFMNLGIQPALGTDSWYEVKNPLIVLKIGKKALTMTRHKLELQFKVVFPKF